MTVPGKELLFLALGGSGEIGMNANLYGCDGKWIMLDLGVSFGSQDYPGIDIVMPDLEFIEDRKADLLGIILTQIWRLEAAQGVSAGQLGVVDAATLADERKFRSMAVDP